MHKARSTQTKPRKNRASVAEITAALLKLKDIPYEPTERLKDTALNARCLFDGNAEAAEAFLDEPNDELGGRVLRQIVGEGLIGYNEVFDLVRRKISARIRAESRRTRPRVPRVEMTAASLGWELVPYPAEERLKDIVFNARYLFDGNAEAADAFLDEPNDELGGRVPRQVMGEGCIGLNEVFSLLWKKLSARTKAKPRRTGPRVPMVDMATALVSQEGQPGKSAKPFECIACREPLLW